MANRIQPLTLGDHVHVSSSSRIPSAKDKMGFLRYIGKVILEKKAIAPVPRVFDIVELPCPGLCKNAYYRSHISRTAVE